MNNTNKKIIVNKRTNSVVNKRTRAKKNTVSLVNLVLNAEPKVLLSMGIFTLLAVTVVLILFVNFIESNISLGFKPVYRESDTISNYSAGVNTGTYNKIFDNYKNTYRVKVNVFQEDSRELVVPMFTVREMLEKYYAPAYLGEAYEVNIPVYTVINGDMEIAINKVSYEEVSIPAEVSFEVEYVPVQTIPKGEEVTVQDGENALVTRTVKKKFINGVYDSESIVNEIIDTPAVNKIVRRGVGGSFTSPKGVTYKYSYYLDVIATAYGVDTGFGGIGKHTYTGEEIAEGMIAVDPQVIPLKSTVYVTGAYKDFGVCTAEDIGAGIVGNKIDIYLGGGDISAQNAFGVRSYRVYILE